MKWEILWESVKLPLRLLLFAFVSWLITAIVPQINNAYVKEGLFLVLTLVDKYLHEQAKEEPAKVRNEGFFGVKGLSGF